MRKFMISSAMRFFFFFTGSVIWLGIWLTGFSAAHWLLYLPPSFFYFAAVSGICPGMLLSRLAFPGKAQAERT
ncbi:MAG TPA: hypothetical protein VKC56_07110 [Gallionellaceae bacterium]|nr:hypothetical protein [Gallionellaceae bacterium]